MSGINSQTRNLKKLLGNPKITFVLGGPASGKGTQCEKLIEEFGYTHISTGDLIRAEMAKGTKEGEKMKKLVAAGALVPFDLTVQILINALIATPSQNYLIDGFPRALDQAIYFEKTVVEVFEVLYYDVPEDLMKQRCLKRAETSGRSDDNAETIIKRVENYFTQTLPVVDYYKKFGKVRHIDATGTIPEVYAKSKSAVLPQVMFMLGPKASGKSTIGATMAARTNMKLIDFNHFIQFNGLEGQDDETITTHFIQSLAKETTPRLVLENFPQNTFQAKFFLRNGTTPSNVFALQCSKDICQERMIDLGENHPHYVSSSILSKQIKAYHEHAKELLPFLEKETCFQNISTDQKFDKTMEEVYRHIEPSVINVRSGKNETLQEEIIKNLSENHGYVNLDVTELTSCEMERKTAIGQEFIKILKADKNIPANMKVKMLNKIIYSGQVALNKFILTNFPEQIDQAKEFELNCSKIAAIIYPTNQGPTVEISNKELSMFNIDSLFQKEFRLKTMSEWSFQLFNEKLGNKIEFGVLIGKSLSGKSVVAKLLQDTQSYTIIDMKQIADGVKAGLGSEEEPFEGEVPVADVEKAVTEKIKTAQASGKRCKFVFDGFSHSTDEAFFAFIEQFGVPEFLMCLTAEQPTINDRWCKKNEAEEVGEEGAEAIKTDSASNSARRQKFITKFEQYGGRVNILHLNTSQVSSIESTTKDLNNKFAPKVILVNHQKALGVDNTCSNLAIKYNMIYISAYQVIKQNITQKTEWGQKLQANRRPRGIDSALNVQDNFQEAEFSAVHFDLQCVMQLLKETVAAKRTNQKFVLLEGLCNSQKLSQVDDQLELRFMDELFSIETILGEVKAVVGLQYAQEPELEDESTTKYEEFEKVEAVVTAKAPTGDDEEGGDEPEAAAEEDEGEKKAPAFDRTEFKWTITNRKPKNLPQLFHGMKGINTLHEVKEASQFGGIASDQVSKCLDDFCGRVQDSDNADKNIYQQVIFQKQ